MSELPVVIVGAGFSGTLLAINLLRQGGRIILVERSDERLARGLAFGTHRPEHLLNVRASNMSAFPDDKSHFLRWIGFSTKEQANRFVPRLAYGQYLSEQLLEALAASGGRAELRTGEAVDATFDGEGVTIHLADGDVINGRALVLAQGNFPPQPIPELAHLPPSILFDDPWMPGATDAGRVHNILLLGTGLTAVDAVLSLQGKGFRGRITALSRRGLRPRSHSASGPVPTPVSRPQVSGSQLLRAIRQRAGEVEWRQAIDELRPYVQHLWRSHSSAAQDRFLRHARAYWDVHRHRLAPAVDERLRMLESSGVLDFAGGRIVEASEQDGGALVTWRPRGSDIVQTSLFDRVVNCTGPQGDLRRVADPLVQSLLGAGRLRPDVHRLGLDVDHLGRVRDSDGEAQKRLFAVGPMTKGEAWEIVAVPDIRRQVWDLARYLTDAHWVGGEGL
ncbi:MAG: FAD/NAD(P)-binding protein [Sphingobium sp.]